MITASLVLMRHEISLVVPVTIKSADTVDGTNFDNVIREVVDTDVLYRCYGSDKVIEVLEIESYTPIMYTTANTGDAVSQVTIRAVCERTLTGERILMRRSETKKGTIEVRGYFDPNILYTPADGGGGIGKLYIARVRNVNNVQLSPDILISVYKENHNRKLPLVVFKCNTGELVDSVKVMWEAATIDTKLSGDKSKYMTKLGNRLDPVYKGISGTAVSMTNWDAFSKKFTVGSMLCLDKGKIITVTKSPISVIEFSANEVAAKLLSTVIINKQFYSDVADALSSDNRNDMLTEMTSYIKLI